MRAGTASHIVVFLMCHDVSTITIASNLHQAPGGRRAPGGRGRQGGGWSGDTTSASMTKHRRRVELCDQVTPQGVRKRHGNKCTGGHTRWYRCSPLRPPSRGRCATAAGPGAGDLRAACRRQGRGAEQRVAVRHTAGGHAHSHRGAFLPLAQHGNTAWWIIVWNGREGGTWAAKSTIGIITWWPDQRHSPTCSAQRADTPSPARSAECV